MKKIILAASALALLAGCAAVDPYVQLVRSGSADAAAAAIEANCKLSLTEREKNRDAINERLAARNHPPVDLLPCP